MAIAIADRLDTLAGIFAIDQKPSGTRDPFGLRRAAIGVLRILVENRLELDLLTLIESAVAAQPVASSVANEVYAYILERLRAQYLEDDKSPGITTEMFDAVLAGRPRSVLDFDARLRALRGFLSRPEAASLTAANKRIANILKKSAGALQTAVDLTLLQPGAEQQLHRAVNELRPGVDSALARREYSQALEQLSQLRSEVDAFFDQVLVNDPDAALRSNRLALLASLRALFTHIADLSVLPG
jgi:glycyl-tRNA synthetase beta chain